MANRLTVARQLTLVWLLIAIVTGGLLSIARASLTALDDQDQAFQRTGFLVEADQSAPELPRGYPRENKLTVLIFDRSSGNELFHDLSLQAEIAAMSDLVLITQDGSQPKIKNGIDLILADSDGSYSKSYGLRQPVDSGYPVGYVVIDQTGFIRYRTLDPMYQDLGNEILTILKALK